MAYFRYWFLPLNTEIAILFLRYEEKTAQVVGFSDLNEAETRFVLNSKD